MAKTKVSAKVEELSARAGARGWILEERDGMYRMVQGNGTLVAGAWNRPQDDCFGMTLEAVEDALQPPSTNLTPPRPEPLPALPEPDIMSDDILFAG